MYADHFGSKYRSEVLAISGAQLAVAIVESWDLQPLRGSALLQPE